MAKDKDYPNKAIYMVWNKDKKEYERDGYGKYRVYFTETNVKKYYAETTEQKKKYRIDTFGLIQ